MLVDGWLLYKLGIIQQRNYLYIGIKLWLSKTCGNDFISCGNDLLSCGNDLLSCGKDLLTCGNDLVYCGNDFTNLLERVSILW